MRVEVLEIKDQRSILKYSARQVAMSVRNHPRSRRLLWMKRRPLERMTRAVKLPHPPNSGKRSKIIGLERSERITVWGRMRALLCFTDNWSLCIDPLAIFLSRDFTHNSERNKSIYLFMTLFVYLHYMSVDFRKWYNSKLKRVKNYILKNINHNYEIHALGCVFFLMIINITIR